MSTETSSVNRRAAKAHSGMGIVELIVDGPRVTLEVNDFYMEITMRAYPTSKEVPNRKQRKSQRKVIFAENRWDSAARRRARRDARKAAK